jgi:hypothetical protein
MEQARLNAQRRESEKTFLSEDEQKRLDDLEKMFKEKNKDGEDYTK